MKHYGRPSGRGGPRRHHERTLTPLSATEREMIISADGEETRIAFLEQGRLAEYYFERQDESSIVGNIYKGRVASVLPGLQAAFIDIGLERSGFLHARDILTESMTIEDFIDARKALGQEEREEEEGNAEGAAGAKGGRDRHGRPPRQPIQDLIKKGQDILVQVEKESISTKGPRLTGQISMPSRLLVLIPHAEHCGVSHRITNERERSRLKTLLDKYTPKGFGVIARTSAENATEADIKNELAYLIKLYRQVSSKEKKGRAPFVLHAEQGLVHRVARDLLTREDKRIIIDATDEGQHVKSWLVSFLRSFKPKIELYEGEVPLFEALNLEGEIDKALRPKVWLKSGGYLIIEETEAMVVVDVNTGRHIGKTRQDETILKTNLEAAEEIARQLRLRDLGGIVVLDFIDMRIEEHKERVYLELAQALQHDRAKTSLRQLTDLGLIEMTRKRVRGSLLRTLSEHCPMCRQRGWIRSRDTLMLRLRRMLEQALRLTGESDLTLEVSPYMLHHLPAVIFQERALASKVQLMVVAKTDLVGDDLRLVSPATHAVLVGAASVEN